ncbi:NUDIX domain-containing protein [Hazenella sp. IB182353]|uniref:NUDIX hydrolase n=1 Tax=Polycladospora coralii TaxID=2771432 RepID=UPI001746D210|nr:NUDIX domain-containing protein [Polycladospora coralii]MBS7529025.1 NUDIX domain-containing protein [Polycladospora coralii]
MKIRKTARILLLNEQNQLLLFHMINGINQSGTVWFSPGGGVEDNETYEEAAQRELKEETGITTQVEWGPVVWIREIDLIWKGTKNRFIEHYYLAYVRHISISLAHMTTLEKENYLSHHWWTLQELEETAENIFPIHIATHLRPIINGHIPKKPISIL